MLNPRQQNGLLVVAVFLFACFWSLALSGSLVIAPTDCASQECKTAPKQKQQYPNDSLAEYTLWLVFITGGIVITGILTYRVLRNTDRTYSKQLEVSRRANEHFRVSERAYVSAIPNNLVFKADGSYIAIVDLQNTGRTPAFDTQSSCDMKVMEYPRKRPFLFNLTDDGTPVATFVIFPTAQHITAVDKIFPTEDLKKLSDKGYALYVYGRISYFDAFDIEQWTEFCAVLDKPAYEEWLMCAKGVPGTAVEARFKFTEFNNRASRNGG